MLCVGVEATNDINTVSVLSDESGHIIAATRQPFPVSLHTTPRTELRVRLSNSLTALSRAANLKTDDLATACICIGMP